MNYPTLPQLLDEYITEDPTQLAFRNRFHQLVQDYPACYMRECFPGHITASCWVTDTTATTVALVHHKKLNRWLQPGGHADGETNVVMVAVKEAQEELGLRLPLPPDPHIFDLDIHSIPAFRDTPEHLHYDVRFWFSIDRQTTLYCSNESNKVQWIDFNSQIEFELDASVQRMIFKAQQASNKGK